MFNFEQLDKLSAKAIEMSDAAREIGYKEGYIDGKKEALQETQAMLSALTSDMEGMTEEMMKAAGHMAIELVKTLQEGETNEDRNNRRRNPSSVRTWI